MKKFRISQLSDTTTGHFLRDVLPGRYLCMGGMGYKKPGQRSHSHDGPGGSDRHVHEDDHEVFVILQGKGWMEIDGEKHPVVTGDICVVEPGEDHHLISATGDPIVNLWLHAGPRRHPEQERPAG
jgi:mannose-6-phosphate isomerase-like protein (cupin superfamily)